MIQLGRGGGGTNRGFYRDDDDGESNLNEMCFEFEAVCTVQNRMMTALGLMKFYPLAANGHSTTAGTWVGGGEGG